MHRRTAILTLLGLPAAALAHDGHGAADVVVGIDSAVVQGDRVTLSATLRNLGTGTIEVTDVAARGGSVTSAALPLTLAPDQTRQLVAEVLFDGPAPGIFSLELAFGDAGSGPVLVMPTPKGDSDD